MMVNQNTRAGFRCSSRNFGRTFALTKDPALIEFGITWISWILSRFRKFGQRDKWKGCSLTAIKMAETRSNDDTTSTAESHSNLQSEGGPCRAEEIGRA